MGDQGEEKVYKFEELCLLAGVPERTVRYYVHEGLLPPSDGSGRAAGYTRDHLLRLTAIRYLNKVKGLTLAEIKLELKTMTRSRLETLYRESMQNPYRGETESTSKPNPGPQGQQVLDYLAGLKKSNRTDVREAAANYTSPGWPTPVESQRSEQPAVSLASKLQPVEPATGNTGESWQRVTLAPEVELHYKQLDPQQDQERYQKILQLLEQARNLFNP